MWPNRQFPADLVTFTEEILNGKLIFVHGKDAVLSLFNFVFTLAKLRVHTYLTESWVQSFNCCLERCLDPVTALDITWCIFGYKN